MSNGVVLYLKPQELRARLGVSNSWLDRHVRNETFPAPIKLDDGHNAPRRWPLKEIEKWEARRKAARSNDQARIQL